MDSNPQNPLHKLSNPFTSIGLLSVVFLLVMVFIMGLIKIYSPDLGFHLKSAKWMLENKRFIYTDSFSYGSEGREYFNLQWLFQLFIYSIYNYGGEMVLVLANALLINFSVFLLWVRFLKTTGL